MYEILEQFLKRHVDKWNTMEDTEINLQSQHPILNKEVKTDVGEKAASPGSEETRGPHVIPISHPI